LAVGAVAVLVVLGGIGYLALWDAPAPAKHIEQTLPDDRFPH
jgi:hypothetical protein